MFRYLSPLKWMGTGDLNLAPLGIALTTCLLFCTLTMSSAMQKGHYHISFASWISSSESSGCIVFGKLDVSLASGSDEVSFQGWDGCPLETSGREIKNRLGLELRCIGAE